MQSSTHSADLLTKNVSCQVETPSSQSLRLIIRWSTVQVCAGPPLFKNKAS